jgi:hypothetical protein
MKWEEVIKVYGEEMAKKMSKSKMLRGITITMTDDGKPDIPESDIRLAYKDVTGQKIHDLEWD